MEKFVENLVKADKMIRAADHMIYVSFPLVRDKKILLKVLRELKTAVTYCISSILQYEYLYKRIRLHSDPNTNMRTFQQKCAERYKIMNKDLKLIMELFDLVEKQKKSSMEFIKDEKIVILSDNLKPQTVTVEKIKEFLPLSKQILEKAKTTILP